MLLSRQSGWGLNELLELDEAELVDWLDTGRRIQERMEGH
jgi:hypothetical protein